MNILVTGGSGLIGRSVVAELAAAHRVSVLDLRPPAGTDVPFLRTDILDAAACRTAVRGFDAVVHLAGIPHPLNDPPERVYAVNTLGTYHLLEASAASSVPKFVFMSSESTLGFAFSTTRMWPLALPVDETHPLRPQDPYGLSKVAAEVACEGFTRRTGMRTVALRAPWVWVPEPAEVRFYRRLVEEYPNWYKNLWAFVDVRDVARAIRLACERDLPSLHERLFLAADENWTGRPSRDLLRTFYPESPAPPDSWTGAASFISNRKAKDLLGFSPSGSASSILSSHA